MSRIIDLTLSLDNDRAGVSIEPARHIETDGWNATTLHLYSHCGTHMDAPKHFEAGEQTIDQIPLDRCMGPAWVVDLRNVGPRTLIGVDDVASVTEKIRPGEGLLLHTGWSRRVGDPSYRNSLPRVSLELAQWCVTQGVRTLGVEPPSIADVNNLEELTNVHSTLLGAGIIIVEGLTNLDQIRNQKVTFMALPLKITEGDGAPARALAIED
jgi:kynurenine formamidase